MGSTSSSDSDSSSDAVWRSLKAVKARKLSRTDKNELKATKRKNMAGSDSGSGSDSSENENERVPRRDLKSSTWMDSDDSEEEDYESSPGGRNSNPAQISSKQEYRIPRHDPTRQSTGQYGKNGPAVISSTRRKHISDEEVKSSEDEEDNPRPEISHNKGVTRRELEPDAWMSSEESEVESSKEKDYIDSSGWKQVWRSWKVPTLDFEDRIPRYDPTDIKSAQEPKEKVPTIFTPANYYWKVDEQLRFGERKEEIGFSLVKTFGEPEIKQETESESDGELPLYLPPAKRKKPISRETFPKQSKEPDYNGAHYESGSRFLNKMRIPGELQQYQKENQRPTTRNDSFFYKKDDPRFKESREFFSQYVHDEDFENKRRLAKIQLRQRQKKHSKNSWPSQSRRTKAFKF